MLPKAMLSQPLDTLSQEEVFEVHSIAITMRKLPGYSDEERGSPPLGVRSRIRALEFIR